MPMRDWLKKKLGGGLSGASTVGNGGASGRPVMVNLGCGPRVHPRWVNMDLVPLHELVKPVNLSEPLPFADRSVDVIYHSHVLEHLSRVQGNQFIRECHRILRPDGILRVVVPDLAILARNYVDNLNLALAGDAQAVEQHEWTVLHLIDQLVRGESGGEILKYWHREPIRAEDYVRKQVGYELDDYLNWYRGQKSQGTLPAPAVAPRNAKEAAKREAAFRAGGEVHRWMYDRLSLRGLLNEHGFHDITFPLADASAIPDWDSYQFDADATGKPRKPDSLFCEARA